ncbi:MAG TPA: permease [Candidatus Dormibacteraeota bacterium]|nr:permease [Candidatus Dormibacteraeota bacterium]
MSAATTMPMAESNTYVSAGWRKRAIAIALMIGIAGFFWIDSRYPALLRKYNSGTHLKASGAITFDAIYPVDKAMPLYQRVGRTSVNWLAANKIGMTFGFFFGAAALTFLSTLRYRRTRFPQLNALIGAVAGMPLGVCANCVAPIGRGFYASGMATESVLASMFSSPTLNVVVLAMTFALFPLPIALLKLATVLLMLFVFAPLIGAKFSTPEAELARPIDIPVNETWGQAFTSAAKSYARDFWHIAKVGFPLMLLAALLGALAVEIVPQQALTSPVSVLGTIAVCLVGAFLPVPMAFDVVIAYLAMTHGVPLPYVVAILCTLGIYSIYSFSVIGKTISWKLATATYAAVAALGLAAATVARFLS